MLPSSEQKVYERDVPVSVQPVRSRRHMQFPPVGNYAGSSDFSTIYFTLTLPNETVSLHNLRIVCPISFRFWDKTGHPVENMALAPKVWLNNALRSIEFRCNGQSFTQFPENHKHAQACWQWSDPTEDSMQDSGSLLPVVGLYGDTQRTDAANMGFAQRARLFRSQKDERVVAAAAHTVLGGYSYSTELEIIPDMLMFQSFVRKCYSQDMSAAAYAYEMEINMNFRADVENNDAFIAQPKQSDQYIASRLGQTLDIDFFAQQQAIWRECFRIGNPLVDAVIDSELEHSGHNELISMPSSTDLTHAWAFYGDSNNDGSVISTVVANGNHANDATHTTIDVHNVTLFDPAVIRIGDYLMVATAGNTFETNRHAPYAANVAQYWVRISGIAAATGATQRRLTHTALGDTAENNAICQGGDYRDGYAVDRRIRIYPGFIIRDPGTVKYWQVGDLCTLTRPGHEGTPTKFLFSSMGHVAANGRTTIWPTHPIASADNGNAIVSLDRQTQWEKGSYIDNEWSKYGPITVAYDAQNGGPDANNPQDIALTRARFTVPIQTKLATGDVIKLECEDSPYKDAVVRDFNGLWRVVVEDEKDSTEFVAHDDPGNPAQTGITFDYINRADNSPGSAVFIARNAGEILVMTTATQHAHMGGRVILTKMKGSMVSPISYISGVWSKDPYIRVEAIQNDVMKDAYTFPLMKNEIYKETVRISATQPTIDGVLIPKKVTIRLKNIRLLEGFSSLHIYACLDEDLSRRLELYCAFGDCFFDISNVQIRVDNKFCLDGHEPEKWLYEQHKRVTESEMNYVQWKTKRKVISVDAETLALPTFFEGAARLYDCEVNFDVSYSQLFKELVKKINITRNTLVEGDHASHFVNSLNVSARVAIEYRRKAVKISREGDLEVQHNKIRQADSGLELGVQQKTILRSGGDPEAFIKSFDS